MRQAPAASLPQSARDHRRAMHLPEARDIRPGWEAIARNGARAGTVIELTDDELVVRSDGGGEEVRVPTNLIVEAHAGRVEIDLSPEELGIAGSDRSTTGPTRDPGAPPEVVTAEQMRRLAGG